MLKSLDLHNAEVMAAHTKQQRLNSGIMRTGLECPRCKAELFDSKPSEFIDSAPPRKEVECVECGYTGERFFQRGVK